jgi:hypothetical protein
MWGVMAGSLHRAAFGQAVYLQSGSDVRRYQQKRSRILMPPDHGSPWSGAGLIGR